MTLTESVYFVTFRRPQTFLGFKTGAMTSVAHARADKNPQGKFDITMVRFPGKYKPSDLKGCVAEFRDRKTYDIKLTIQIGEMSLDSLVLGVANE